MPRNSFTRRLLFFGRGWDEWDARGDSTAAPKPAPAAPRRSATRRFATTLTFCALFFAGLALSAVAGNSVRTLLSGAPADAGASGASGPSGATGASGASAAASASATAAPLVGATKVVQQVHAAPAKVTAVQNARPVTAPESARVRATKSASRPAFARPASKPQARPSHSRTTALRHGSKSTKGKSGSAKRQPLDAEGRMPGATVWLYRAAPDPTPPGARLRIGFARELVADSRLSHVDWTLPLAVLEAGGHNGRVPAGRVATSSLTQRLAALGGSKNGWAAALSYSGGSTDFADHVVALRHYYRAVGMASLVYGLLSQKRDLEERVLNDKRLEIYPGGRNDVATHKVDVRVLAVMLYMADTFHEVTVSCLISGHRLYARPGVISAHIYGRAVDIAALDGVSIYGHQQPGGITEQGVRALLMLPGRMLPAQIISLLGLGGPSFPLADHYNHIHVGY
jgi:hypothetical protein